MAKNSFVQGPAVENLWQSGATVESLPLSGAGERQLTLKYDQTRVGEQPIKASGIILRVSFHDTIAIGAAAVSLPNFGKVLKHVQLDVPNLGLLADRTITTGPALWNYFMPLCMRGRRGFTSINELPAGGVGGDSVDVTMEFKIPFAIESMERPSDTYRLLDELKDAILYVQAEGATCFGAGHTVSAVTCSVHTDTVIDHGANPWQLGGVLCLTQYQVPANSGAKSLLFPNVGKASGPSGTLTYDEINKMPASKFAFLALSGDAFGLPGPDNFADTTTLGCPTLAQPTVQVPDAYQARMIEQLDREDTSTNLTIPGWPLESNEMGEGDVPGVLNQAEFLFFVATGARGKLSQLPALGENFKIDIQKTSMPGEGEWYLLGLEVRDYALERAQILWAKLGTVPTGRKLASGETVVPSAKPEAKIAMRGVPVALK